MTTSHGRRIQTRRALAMLAWVSLVMIAGLLWYGQEEDIIRIQAWEPAALLLSAYSAFLAIFGWLLFAPERKSAEGSAALFFSGMLTLIPPCFIAYHLMPPSSPLRGWLTLSVFVFGLFAILSPLPAEVFAVPRDRKSYLQPLTDCYLSVIDVEGRQLDLQSLVPRSYHTLTTPDIAPTAAPGSPSRDPWADPFYGTGRALSEVGASRRSQYSEDLSRGSDRHSESALLRESVVQDTSHQADYRDERDHNMKRHNLEKSDRTQKDDHERQFAQARVTQHASGLGYPMPRTSVSPVSTMPLVLPLPTVVASSPAIPISSGSSRPPMIARSAFAPRESRTPNYQPTSPAAVTRTPLADPAFGLGTIAAETPLASLVSYDDVLKLAVSDTQPARAAGVDLREMDRRIKELEAHDEQDEDFPRDSVVQSAMLPAPPTSSLNDVEMERLKDSLGGETLNGTIRVVFGVGQKRAHLHVPFSPPLAGLPEVECEAVSDDSVRCKVAVRQPYGIRIEARRSDASSILNTEISFAAVYTPTPRRG